MWFALLLLSLVSADFLNPPDFYFRYLSHELDHSQAPCDNFYRHVCPTGEYNIDDIVLEYLKNITQTENELLGMYEFIDAKYDAQCNETNDTNDALCTDIEELRNNFRNDTFDDIADAIALSNVISTTEFESHDHYFHDLYSELEEDLKTTDVSNSYHKLFVDRLKERIPTLQDAFANLKNVSQNLTETFDNAKTVVKQFNDLVKNDSSISQENIHFILETLNSLSVDDEITFTMNAFAHISDDPLIVYTYNFAYQMLLIRNEALKLGLFYFLIGHEISHPYTYDFITNSSVFHEKAECVATKYKQSCQLFAEDGLACESDIHVTSNEDLPDIQGIRIAYKAFSKKFENKMKQITLQTENDVAYTNEQLFFYGLAINYCATNAGHVWNEDTNGPDEHSGFMVRINTVVKEVSGFETAFDCQPNDRMYQPKEEQCVVFGRDPVKF